MKKTLVVLLALVAFLALFACTKVSDQQSAGGRTTSGRTYTLGDSGPAGGIIFYDKKEYTYGWRYLEAAPVETEFAAIWGLDTDVSGTETLVGSGKRNTELIVAALGENGKAAHLCANLNVNRYKDWFLPSRDELDLMYKNLKRMGLGSFKDNWYWSSSQYGSFSYDAWAQRFSDGSQASNYYSKDNTYLVRAVRAF